MKLKTLKDMVFIEHLTEKQIDELNQEIIKWIKSDILIGDKNHISPEVKNWIKHFFNITEEDLK